MRCKNAPAFMAISPLLWKCIPVVEASSKQWEWILQLYIALRQKVYQYELSYRKDDRAMRPTYMGALKIFESPWVRPRLLVPKFLMGFCSYRSYECAYKIFHGLLFGWTLRMYRPNSQSVAFTRSWDNSDCSFGLSLRTPNLGEGEAVGG